MEIDESWFSGIFRRYVESIQPGAHSLSMLRVLIEYTIPDKPNSRLQKYRLTPHGRLLTENLSKPDQK